MATFNDNTNAIESRVTVSDAVKVTTTSVKFGPLQIMRGSSVPSNKAGRNGDLFILDNTAVSQEALQSAQDPSIASLYQKRPENVSSGPVTYRTADAGLNLIGGDSIVINGAIITFTGGNLKSLATDIETQTASLANPITAQVIPSSQVGTGVGVPTTGDILGIDLGAGVTPVTFTAPFTASHAATQVNNATITGLIANVVNNALVLTAMGGEPIVLSDIGGTPTSNLGPFVFQGGALTLVETTGDLGFNFATPVGASAIAFNATVINQPTSPLTLGGVWVELGGGTTGLFDSYLDPAKLATTAPLPSAPTYSNGAAGIGATLIATSPGALTVDGVAVTLGDRIVIKDQVSALQNGVYEVTDAGSGVNPYILTRAADVDENVDELVNGALIVVTDGTTHADTIWLATSPNNPITIGTSDIYFATLGAAVSTPFEMVDADGDTRLSVEKWADSDTLSLDIGDNSGNYVALTNQLSWNANGVSINLAHGVGPASGGGMTTFLGSALGTGNGGSYFLFSGTALGGNGKGGNIEMFAGGGAGTGNGGDIDIRPGVVSGTGRPGRVIISPHGPGAGERSELAFYDSAFIASGKAVGFKAPDTVINDTIWTLPDDDGTAGQVLATNGSAILSWDTVSSTSIIDGDGNTFIKVDDNPTVDTNMITMRVGDNTGLYDETVNVVEISTAGIDIKAPSAVAGAVGTAGADINIISGDGDNTGSAGSVNISTGVQGISGAAVNHINITTPNLAAGAVGNAGDIRIRAGNSDSVQGGRIIMTSGDGGTTGFGGWLFLRAGKGGSVSGAGGPLFLQGGSISGTGDAGPVNIAGGIATTDNGGDINLIPGRSSSGDPTKQGAVVIDQVPTVGMSGVLRFKDITGALGVGFVGFRAPDDAPTEPVWTLPAADGVAGESLVTDGVGILSWGGGGINVIGTRAVPYIEDGLTTVDLTPLSPKTVLFVESNGGPVNVTAAPQFTVIGVTVGYELVIIGRSDVNTVQYNNDALMELNGAIVLGESDVLNLMWDGGRWLETSRNT